MQYKSVLSFDKGLFIKDGNEKKVIESFLINLLNIDIDIAGKINRRWGYKYWDYLLNNKTIPTKDDKGTPDTSDDVYSPNVSSLDYSDGNTGFQNKIQNIQSYTDVGGNKMIFVITDGKLYSVALDPGDPLNKTLVWSYLNKKNAFINNVKVLKIVSYLDLVFINDAGYNVWYYDSREYNDGGWLKLKNSWIYFNGNKIYYRNYADFKIDGSTTIAISTTDLRGNEIYNSLVTIGLPTIGSMDLGYAIKINDKDGNYNYYVLDRGNVSGTTSYLIKFNSRMIAVSYVAITKKSNSEIINFDYDGSDYIYLMSDDGKINKIGVYSLTLSVLTDGDIAGLRGLVVGATTFYSLAINDNKIWVYTQELENKDRYLPFIINKANYTGSILSSPSSAWNNFKKDTITNTPETLINRIILKTQWNNNLFNIDFKTKYGSYSNETLLNRDTSTKYSGNIVANVHSGSYPSSGTGVDGRTLNYYAYLYSDDSYWNYRYNLIKNYSKFFNYILPKTSNKNGSGNYIYSLPINNKNFNYGLIVNNISLDNTSYIWDSANLSSRNKILYKDINKYLYSALTTDTTSDIYDNPEHTYDTQTHSTHGILGWKHTDYKLYFYQNKWFHEHYGESTTRQQDKFTIGKNSDFAYPHLYPEIKMFDGNTYNRNPNTMLFNGSYINTDYFTLASTQIQSSYAMLVALDINTHDIAVNKIQTIDEGIKDIPYIFLSGKIANIDKIQPIVANQDYIYWGTADTITSTGGHYYRQNAKDLTYDKLNVNNTDRVVDRILNIYGDERLMTVRVDSSGTNIGVVKKDGINKDYISADSGLIELDYTLPKYYSLLSFERQQTTDKLGNVKNNKLKAMGCLNTPNINLNPNSGSTLVTNDKIKYFIVATFTNNEITYRSNSTEDINVLANTEIVLSSIDLNNSVGSPIYKIDDIDTGVNNGILIYRSINNNPYYLVGNIQSTNIGTITTFTDSGLSDGSVFQETHVKKYLFNDMVVHKNRLVLVNRLDYVNSNVIFYSDVDIVNSIPEINFRAIESGDGDELLVAKSLNEYLYLFKNKKIYAILGDVHAGQLIDISKTMGTPYPTLITEFDNTLFYINDFSVFSLNGDQVLDIGIGRLDYLFDRNRADSIDFINLKDNGSVFVDKVRREIKWYLTRKENGNSVIRNNIVLIYSVIQNNFRLYKYADNIVIEKEIRDLETDTPMNLIADYDGNIYRLNKEINDNGKSIYWFFMTKDFNMETNIIKKRFKLLKIHGKFPNNVMINYWIDGEKKVGEIIYRKKYNGEVEGKINIWSNAMANSISVEITGYDETEVPSIIDELLIGYDRLRKL